MSFLKLKQVEFAWPKGQPVLNGVSLDIAQDSTIALMGSNGSGKTTLGKIMMGMLKPTAGDVLLEEKLIASYTLPQRGQRIGYVFQNPEKQLFAATVYEEIGFSLKFKGLTPAQVDERVREMLDLFELEYCALAFPFNLSHGEKQRLALAGIMALEPKFIIMDEPSTGLDWLRRQRLIKVLERVRSQGVGYILISHDLGFCSTLCAKTVRLEGGALR